MPRGVQAPPAEVSPGGEPDPPAPSSVSSCNTSCSKAWRAAAFPNASGLAIGGQFALQKVEGDQEKQVFVATVHHHIECTRVHSRSSATGAAGCSSGEGKGDRLAPGGRINRAAQAGDAGLSRSGSTLISPELPGRKGGRGGVRGPDSRLPRVTASSCGIGMPGRPRTPGAKEA